MTTGTLEKTFEFNLQGVELGAVTSIDVPAQSLTARLVPGDPIRLEVRVEMAPEVAAEARADALAALLYRQLLLTFGHSIDHASSPRAVQRGVTVPAATRSPSVIASSATVKVTAAIVATATVVLAPATIGAVARDVALRIVAAQPPTSAQLYTAIDMYVAGLETNNRVVRFLIFYSAVGLASLFRSHKAGQADVDALLISANPSVATSPSPRGHGSETLYTKLRNDFVHSEERGCNPALAIIELERHIGSFQADVATVFRSL